MHAACGAIAARGARPHALCALLQDAILGVPARAQGARASCEWLYMILLREAPVAQATTGTFCCCLDRSVAQSDTKRQHSHSAPEDDSHSSVCGQGNWTCGHGGGQAQGPCLVNLTTDARDCESRLSHCCAVVPQFTGEETAELIIMQSSRTRAPYA